MQVTKTILVSPDGIFTVANFPSRAINCANAPALLAITAPLPGTSSMQEMIVPRGISESKSAFPNSGETPSPELIF
jgi:hypothetical protein